MSTQLVTQEVSQNTSMLAIIDRAARDPDTDVGKMERLLAMAKDMRASEAQSAFFAAMNDAQGEMRSISKDCHNLQTRSKYASYQAIDNEIRPIYSKHGFSMSFGSRASTVAEHVVVTCKVSHRAGHAESHELDMPADGRGLKGGDMMTKTHATGSALTYGKRYLAGLIWNLSYGETDDDGNAASPKEHHAPQPEQSAGTHKTRVISVAEKTGTTNGKTWTVHIVKCANGIEAGTFDTKIRDAAQQAFDLGDECEVNVKPGRKQGSWELVSVKEIDEVPA